MSRVLEFAAYHVCDPLARRPVHRCFEHTWHALHSTSGPASVLVCPVHSAAVERGFSIHRVVLKDRLINRLLLTTLDSAMSVKMLVSKDDILKFDLGVVVAVFESSHPRNGQTPSACQVA